MQDEILSVIKQAHYFNSAYTFENIYIFLRVKCDNFIFEKGLNHLIASGDVLEINDYYYTKDYSYLSINRQANIQYSFELFELYRSYLKLFAKIPWIKLISLTGSNSFESCEKDKAHDIDLFIVTAKNRVWLSFILLFIIKMVLGKRYMIDANFFIDSDRLEIYHKSYYSAVQLLQMIPLHDSIYSKELLAANQWISDYLPNATIKTNHREEYLIVDIKAKINRKGFTFLRFFNQGLFKAYNFMKQRFEKFNTQGECFYLTPYYAKLHKYDHHKRYDQLYHKEKIGL